MGMTDHFKTMEIPDSLDAVLADGNWEAIFNAYAKTNFQAESMDFLRSVAAFEQSGDVALAKEIHSRFVAEGSAAEVNLSNAARGPIDEAFANVEEDGVSPGVFDGAKNAITSMMSADVFPRFVTEAKAFQASLSASEDWDAVATRGRSGGGDAPLPADYHPAPPADEPPPPPPGPPADVFDDIEPPPPGADDDLPPVPEDDDDEAPPPPPPGGPSSAPAGHASPAP
jgi:hypothetical protein